MTRRFLVDTDTGSDDAVALVMMLRAPEVRVEAITVSAGNVGIGSALRNAAASIRAAGSYAPPVHSGADRPLLREALRAENVHGEGGMSGMELPEPPAPAPGAAALAIVEAARRFPGELELLTLGPLTNLALALALDRGIAGLFKGVTLMAGAGLGPGNVSPHGEFNVVADPEAAAIVLRAGLHPTLVGWDACLGPALLDEAWLGELTAGGGEAALFCERCTRSVRSFYRERFRLPGFGLADPAAAAFALRPSLAASAFEARLSVETAMTASYGQVIMDRRPGVGFDGRVVTALDGAAYRAFLLDLLAG